MKVKSLKTNSAFSQCGYTLVEVLSGVFILAILMLALFAGLAGGYTIINSFRQDMRATQILTQKIEFVRLCKWSQVNSLPATFQDYYYTLGTSNAISETNIIYYGTISVGAPTNIPSSASSYTNNIKLVTIGLTWTNNIGRTIIHKRQAQTMVAYYGLVNYIYGSGFIQQ